MNRTQWTIGIILIIGCLTVAVPAGTLAKSPIVPGGPWISENQQNVSLQRLSSYTELAKRLKQIEKSSQGRIVVNDIGDSNEGRNIYLAIAGDLDNDRVMIITQQHGNEPMTTEAALKLLQWLGSGNDGAEELLATLCVLIIPRVNPDGAEMFHRYNVDPEAPAMNTAEGFYTARDAGVGWDINRYHWANGWELSTLYQYHPDEYPENPVPEAVAVIDSFNTYNPIWIADFHHQATYVTEDGENVTSSILWPKNEAVDPAIVDLSKQLCVQIYDHMQQFGFATVTLYPGGTYAGIGRNGYGLAGAGSILVELKGGIGQKSGGMIIKHAYEQMLTVLQATADGSLYAIDPTRSDEIPERGDYYYKQIPPDHEEEPE